MPGDSRELADFIQHHTRPYLDSRRSIGLSAGAVAAERECLVFGGSVSLGRQSPPAESMLFEIGSITKVFGCLGPLVIGGLGGLLAWQSFGLPLWSRFLIPAAVPFAMYPLWQAGLIGSLDDMALG